VNNIQKLSNVLAALSSSNHIAPKHLLHSNSSVPDSLGLAASAPASAGSNSSILSSLAATALQPSISDLTGVNGTLSIGRTDPLMLANNIAVKRQLQLMQMAVQQDALMSEAYKRGRDVALISLMGPHSLKGFGEQDTAFNNSYQSEHVKLDEQCIRKQYNAFSKLGCNNRTRNLDEREKSSSSYFDASALQDPDPLLVANRRTRGGVTEPFPEKLHRMLQEAEENGEANVVSFFSHGRAFMVQNQVRFVAEIMPKYFRQSRMSSFQRQLNIYGFRRITSGPDTGGYYHELFLKGRPNLAVHMRRVGVHAQGTKRIQPNLGPKATKEVGL